MSILEVRPENLEDLASKLTEQLRRCRVRGVRVRREADSVTIETPLHDRHWALEWDEPVCKWKLDNTQIRLVLSLFHASCRLQEDWFVLRVSDWKPEEHSLDRLLRDLHSTAWSRPRSAVQEVFLKRALNAMISLGELQEPVLTNAIAAPSDPGVLVRALQSPEALAPARATDPLLEARLRGIAAKQQLLEAFGGTLSSEEAAKTLRVTRQAVDKRRRKGQLFAVELGRRGYYYPAWQFGDAGTLPGLEQVLAALNRHDAWMQLAFFVNPNPRLGSKTPVETLRKGQLERVLSAANTYGEQGAA
jgi:hypothetical protein